MSGIETAVIYNDFGSGGGENIAKRNVFCIQGSETLYFSMAWAS